MSQRSVQMHVMVWFDDEHTDADGVSNALDTLLETAMSTPGILDEYGPIEVGGLVPQGEGEPE